MKYIRKTYQGVVPNGKILNRPSDSLIDTYSCDYINKLTTFSNNEIIVGTWFGKTLYQKAIKTTTGTGTTVHNIGSVPYTELINMECMISAGSPGNKFYYPFPDVQGSISIFVNNGSIFESHADNYWDNCDLAIIVRYTKD